MEIFAKWDLDAVVIGAVTDDGMLRVSAARRGSRLPADRAAGRRRAGYERPFAPPADLEELQRLDLDAVPLPGDYSADCCCACSTRPTSPPSAGSSASTTSSSAATPWSAPGSDAAVLRIKGTHKALALSVDCNSRYCLLDPYVGAMIAVVEAARNVVCARRRAARRHRLPQLRQPGEAGDHVAVPRGRARASATPAWRSACRW